MRIVNTYDMFNKSVYDLEAEIAATWFFALFGIVITILSVCLGPVWISFVSVPVVLAALTGVLLYRGGVYHYWKSVTAATAWEYYKNLPREVRKSLPDAKINDFAKMSRYEANDVYTAMVRAYNQYRKAHPEVTKARLSENIIKAANEQAERYENQAKFIQQDDHLRSIDA